MKKIMYNNLFDINFNNPANLIYLSKKVNGSLNIMRKYLKNDIYERLRT